MAEVVEKETLWLWKNYIPLEAITLINGDPDAGKSWYVLNLATRVSLGRVWPDGAKNTPAKTYYMTYEDTIDQQIKKRLRLMGANQKNIEVFRSDNPINLVLAEEDGRERLE
ncbi:unnamed protein product, partial [marine sediment metagenome]